MNVPLRGSLQWQIAEVNVYLRRLGRALVRDIPGASLVPWREVATVWDRRLQRIGLIYFAVGTVALIAWLLWRVLNG